MLIGLDEVGRGSLAGPLVVGAVIHDHPIKGLRDSKLLSPKQRLKLSKTIHKQSLSASLGWVWPEEIEELGLSAATSLAMQRALDQASYDYSEIIIDGNFNYLPHLPNVKTLIKADNIVPAVSAASIIAKVARDNYMKMMDSYLPTYGFISHVGYGTSDHMNRLRQFGASPIHRASFKGVI